MQDLYSAGGAQQDRLLVKPLRILNIVQTFVCGQFSELLTRIPCLKQIQFQSFNVHPNATILDQCHRVHHLIDC